MSTRICGRRENWTIEQWVQVLKPCAGQKDDLLYEHKNVKVGFVERTVTGKPVHWARILWSVNDMNVNDRFERQQIYLPRSLSISIEWECGMQEQKMNGLRSVDVRMCLRRSLWQKAKRKKMRPKRRLRVNTFGLCVNQRRLRPKIFGLRTNALRMGTKRFLGEVGGYYFGRRIFREVCGDSWKDNYGKPTLSSCQVSSKTLEFDRGKGLSVCEPKLAEFSLSDLLNERIVPLVKYLDSKMVKYSVPASSASSYVELVRIRTKTKALATAGVTERIAILTSECATVTVT
ncbi:hypothetical protein AXG93_4201s1580 [Marchantia polymorpha subsp. ruderalis]|uniref:Uncharacterized protein n=1 Tax=Marchantia polymorpha subsp. ruderalis TaxID=1480154 RepID=A0A176WDZ7_MARPO|nr:hypothetical protein AXG93_4201s1580 [Marchantia polymorpha subsp. ruderalis]